MNQRNRFAIWQMPDNTPCVIERTEFKDTAVEFTLSTTGPVPLFSADDEKAVRDFMALRGLTSESKVTPGDVIAALLSGRLSERRDVEGTANRKHVHLAAVVAVALDCLRPDDEPIASAMIDAINAGWAADDIPLQLYIGPARVELAETHRCALEARCVYNEGAGRCLCNPDAPPHPVAEEPGS